MAGRIIVIIIVILLGLLVVLPFVLSLIGFPIFDLGSLGARTGVSGVLLRSPDLGGDWEDVSNSEDPQKFPFPGQLLSFAFHPASAETIYFGAKSNGFWKSINGGASWGKVADKSGLLNPSADVQKIIVSRSNPQIIYLDVYQGNRGRIFRSEDGGESFREIYFTTSDRFLVSDFFVDPFNSEHLIIATGQGGLLESLDGGKTWHVLRWFSEALKALLVNPTNPKEIIALTASDSLFKSLDGGANWADLNQGLVEPRNTSFNLGKGGVNPFSFSSRNFIQTLIFDPNNFSTLYMGATSGLFRSQDGGFTWQRLNILIPPEALPIDAVAVHPFVSNTIFVAASFQLHRTDDGGINWSVKTLPTRNRIKGIFIEPLNPQIMFSMLRR